jgi:hypothetical protein
LLDISEIVKEEQVKQKSKEMNLPALEDGGFDLFGDGESEYFQSTPAVVPMGNKASVTKKSVTVSEAKMPTTANSNKSNLPLRSIMRRTERVRKENVRLKDQ